MKTLPKDTVLLVEDSPENRKDFSEALRSVMDKEGFQIKVIDEVPSEPEPYEELIAEQLRQGESIAMVVADRDLSSMSGGLSDAAFVAACDELAIPICRYTRKAGAKQAGVLEAYLQADSFHAINIDTSEGFTRAAEDVGDICVGFKKIGAAVAQIPEEIQKNGAAAVLAAALGRPEIEGDLTLYGGGTGLETRSGAEVDKQKRLGQFLGYWLFNRVLRFPGTLLNQVATGSYVNVNPEDLDLPNVEAVLSAARYDGPFGARKKYWWRRDLDRILDEAEVGDAFELCTNRGIAVSPATCCEEDHSPPGYFCVASQQPVCSRHSIGGFSWIPKGADLARVRQSLYEELEPWLNI